MYDLIKTPFDGIPYILRRLSFLNIEGIPQLNHVTEMSPLLPGVRAVDLRYSERYGDISFNIPPDDIRYVTSILNPSQSYEYDKQFEYHHNTDGGISYTGNDGVTTAGSNVFYVPTGRFLDVGGLGVDSAITIDGSVYTIESPISDSVVLLTTSLPTSSTNATWSYISGYTTRILFFQVNGGLDFIRANKDNTTIRASVNILAPSPFWYGALQSITWSNLTVLNHKIYPVTYPEGNVYEREEAIADVILYPYSDVAVKPVITLINSISSFRMENGVNGTSITYSKAVNEGETVVIDLYKSTAISYPSGANVWVNVGGDRVTFQLEPKQFNPISINTDILTATTSVKLEWRNSYLRS